MIKVYISMTVIPKISKMLKLVITPPETSHALPTVYYILSKVMILSSSAMA